MQNLLCAKVIIVDVFVLLTNLLRNVPYPSVFKLIN